MDKLAEVRNKKEFSKLPDSIIKNALEKSDGDVKIARANLRKYFGLFLTNKIIKAKFTDEQILKQHISSKKRDYEIFYKKIFENIETPSTIIDLGAGVNGLSYKYLEKIMGKIDYIAVEASGQLIEQTNSFFKKNNFSAQAIHEDITNVQKINQIIRKTKKPRIAFLFQVIDALENFQKDFSKKFLEEIAKTASTIIITLPLESIGKQKNFNVQRKWLLDFLEKKFTIQKDFKLFGERTIVCKIK